MDRHRITLTIDALYKIAIARQKPNKFQQIFVVLKHNYVLLFDTLGLRMFCFAQTENNLPLYSSVIHTYLLTYYPTGTQVLAKLPDRVPGATNYSIMAALVVALAV